MSTTLAVEVVNGNPAERILVVAPNYMRFTDWCHRNDINPHAANVGYAGRPDDLRGCGGAWYVNLGVPDSSQGDRLGDLLEYMKAAHGFKSAEVAAAEIRPQPGTPEFDVRTAELRGKGFGFEADARDRLSVERRGDHA